MRAAFTWLRRYWYIPLFVIAGVVGFVLLGRWRTPGVNPLSSTLKELDAIQAGAEIEKVRVELGAAEAEKHVREKYAERLANLDDAQRVRVSQLEGDPAALARYIVRGSS